MYRIDTDIEKNIMYLFMHMIDKSTAPDLVSDIEDACHSLQPGFSCIIVYPENHKSIKDRDFISQTMNLIYAYGAKRFIRVINDQLTVPTIAILDKSSVLPEPKIESVGSLKEAETLIDPQ